MPRIQYPNVPNVSGVPQVLRQFPAAPPAILGTAAGIAQLLRSFTSKSVWGVFRTTSDTSTTTVHGKAVVTPDSIVDFGYQKEWNITSAPTQNGGFVDYNRVTTPYEAHLRMTKGGAEKDRTAFLKQIDDLAVGTQLYDIFTPEKVYLRCSFTRVEVSRRGEKGAYWLSEVDLYFREIRIVTSQYTTTMIADPVDASAANVQNDGVQQISSIDVPVPSFVVEQ